MRTNLVIASLTAIGICVSPVAVLAQAAPPPVVIDGIPYVLPAGAAKNVEAVKVLIAATDALGMLRNVVRTFGATTHSLQYRATGTMGGQQVSVVVGYDYRMPAIRMDVTRADKSREITVANGDIAWDESKPGIFLQPGKTSAAERVMPLWLLPAAVVFEGSAAPDAIKLTTFAGMRVLTVPVPRYKSELKATLNAASQITHTEMSVGGKLYSADYSNYQSDRVDYHVWFPHKIVQKVDGTTIADLTVSEHVTGPYLVFPIPAQMKPAAAK